MPNHYDTQWIKERIEGHQPVTFFFFWGHTQKNEATDKSCFSQWFPSPFTVDNVLYKTCEHWMMAQKALLFADSAMFAEIIAANTPKQAKALGRKVADFDEQRWNAHRYEIVRTGNLHKFTQHASFAAFLLSTAPHVIVEASPMDAIWGIGLSADSTQAQDVHTWRGLNLLGFALMEVRDLLKNPDLI